MLQGGRRAGPGHGSSRAELAALALVLLAGAGTAWWAGQRIQSRLDMSGLSSAARVLGIFDRDRPLHEAIGSEPSDQAASPPAAYCPAGQQPTFALGVAELKRRLGDTMGSPVECEHPVSASGDTVQQTTTGLVWYRAATNTVTFTDGWRHWALTPSGVLSWEGREADPPTG